MATPKRAAKKALPPKKSASARASVARREPAHVTKRSRREPMTLSLPYRTWIVDNLLNDAEPAALIEALVAQGVAKREAQTRVDELATSAALLRARAYKRRVTQLEMVLRLEREAARTVENPGAIERVAQLEPEVFFRRYYAANRPVVLTDLVKRWPAYQKWSPAYFKERFGAAPVQMCDGRDGDADYDMHRDEHAVMTTMGAFVDRVLAAGATNDFYLIARNYNTQREALAPLFDDIDWGFGYLDRATAPRSSALWFGPAGTVTPLHHDSSSILFTQVYGTKKLVLASPAETALLDGMRAMYAAVDPEKPDFAKHPRAREVLFREVVLEAGEALFIPAGWWHYVRALTVSISVALNGFVRPNPFTWYHPGSTRAPVEPKR